VTTGSRVHLGHTPTGTTIARLSKQGWEASWHEGGGVEPRAELLEHVAGAAGVVTVLTQRVDDELLDAAGPALQVVANLAVGFDNFDLDAMARHRVVGTNTPGAVDAATADLAMALVLAAARRVAEGDRFLRTGVPWSWQPDMLVGMDLSAGRTLGIVGLGRIGSAVARRARAFDLRVVATGRAARGAAARELGVEPVDLPELLRRSDVVSLHCPLTPQTHHLIGRAELASMRPGAILVNTSRGPVVDEEALVDALRSGRLSAAGLDVFEHEPAVHPGLLELENVVLVPHLGSAADRTRQAMADRALGNVAAVLAGEPPRDPVTPGG
jgi:lactate dehydrogenase-like 2-hydroxyacid dehydrogenase